MKRVHGLFTAVVATGILVALAGCAPDNSTADQQQQAQQEQIDQQATSMVGMPGIKNFTERKALKLIYELRDNANLVTYMYTENAMDGKWVYQGTAVGFPIPYSTEYTNPEQATYRNYAAGVWDLAILPQADPNGLFQSQNTNADWIMRMGPNGLYPAYCEPNTYVSPVKLPANLCESWSIPSGY